MRGQELERFVADPPKVIRELFMFPTSKDTENTKLIRPFRAFRCSTVNCALFNSANHCVTNTLQLPSFSPRSTYFFWINWSSSF